MATQESVLASSSQGDSANQTQPDPSQILQVGFAFWGSKVLLTAVELGVFTHLGDRTMTGEEVQQALDLHPAKVYDFLDALVAMGFLYREGSGLAGRYRNTESTAVFLDKNKPGYIGGFLEMANDRLYKYWGDLGTGLKTGKPQNEVKYNERPFFEVLYEDPAKLEQFIAAMAGASRGNALVFAEKFDFSRYQTLCDVGGASGLLARTVAQRHPHLQCTTFDLPPVEPIARKAVAHDHLTDRVQVISGDFFKDTLPKADVITMGYILHDWNLEQKKHLIRLAYDALPEGGAFVAIENLIDDDRRHNAFGLMMSLNMLIETGDGFDYTGADFWNWCQAAGFQRYEVIPLAGPSSAAIAYK